MKEFDGRFAKENRSGGDEPNNSESVARRFVELFNGDDRVCLEETVTPDCVAHLPIAGTVVGIGKLGQYVSRYRTAFPDGHTTIESCAIAQKANEAEDDVVVMSWRNCGTLEGRFFTVFSSGFTVKATGVSVMRIAENQVDEVWVEYDTFEPVYVLRELADWVYRRVSRRIGKSASSLRRPQLANEYGEGSILPDTLCSTFSCVLLPRGVKKPLNQGSASYWRT
jgi:SnoaL-like polyketide cyclase